MDSLVVAQEAAAFEYFSKEFWVVVRYGSPILLLFLLKDWGINFLYYVIIRLSTSYQFQNNFCMDGRHCQILEMKFQNVFVIDLDTEDVIQIRNKDFVGRDIWHKQPPRSKWTEQKRDLYQKKSKQIKKNKNSKRSSLQGEIK